MIYRAPSSASAADVVTFLMTCAIVRMETLFVGCSELLDRKKWPLDWLLVLVLLSYSASLWAAKIMSLAV